MIHRHRILTGGILVVMVISVIGCGKNSNIHLSGLVPAKGVVKYNDSPVEGATVLFVPDGTVTTEQRTASGLTDAKGGFVVMTLQPEDGIFPGNYKVTVTKETTNVPLPKQGERTGPAPKFTNQLPAKYAVLATTPLSITFEQKGNKNIVFDLTD